MADLFYNNFTAGIVSPKMGGRTESTAYHNGVKDAVNFVPMVQGGFTRRPGLVKAREYKGALRLIPWAYSSDLSFMVVLGDGFIDVLSDMSGDGTWPSVLGSPLSAPYAFKASETDEVCYTQDPDTLYMTHENHRPVMLTWNGTAIIVAQLSPLCLYKHIKYADYVDIYLHKAYAKSADGSEGFSLTDDTLPYVGWYYSDDKDHQSSVFTAYTWQAADQEVPARDVGFGDDPTKPYIGVQYTNRRDDGSSDPKDYYWQKTVDSGDLAQTDNRDRTISFEDGTDYPRGCKYYMSRLWLYSSVAHPYRVWVSRPFDTENFETYSVVVTVSETASADAYAEAVATGKDVVETVARRTVTEVITEDNAFILELGGNRNDSIRWVGAVGGKLVIGTSASEWLIDGSINAIEHNATQGSSYGSGLTQCLQTNGRIMFVTSGARRLRTYGWDSYQGVVSEDMTFFSDDIINAGVKAMDWQRVVEPRGYFVLKDGTMAVLCYDPANSMTAWCRWTTALGFQGVAVLDDPKGQTAYVISGGSIMRLDPSTVSEADSVLVTERLEQGSTIGRRKRVSRARLRVLDSGTFSFGYEDGTNEVQEAPIEEGEADLLIRGGYERDLRLKVTASGDEKLTMLAMVLETEVAN